jgi:hypothetical protein
MPKSSKKKSAPVQPVAPTPPPSPEPSSQVPWWLTGPVIYDRLEIDERSTASSKGPITVAWAKTAMGWETEKEYQARMVATKGGKPEHYLFGEAVEREDGTGLQPVHCLNLASEKVVCWNNSDNRPLDVDWCNDLSHTVLTGAWVGPHTIPGETVNGETVRISRYGRIISAQHQLTGLILASEKLAKARQDGVDPPGCPKYPTWRKYGAEDIFIETIVVKGMSEDPRVLMSVDYVKPRSVADVFYTTRTFSFATPPERKELCRMLAVATDTLWSRTDARGYKTHTELVAFLDRHQKLLECVEHLYRENGQAGGRRISKLRLSAGQCAALMYIMASGGPGTDGDVYRNEEPAPSERNLDWEYLPKAESFWSQIGAFEGFASVREALVLLRESSMEDEGNLGLGGRIGEKLAILAKAWKVWRDHPDTAGPPFSREDLLEGGALYLSYARHDKEGKKLPDGVGILLDDADFLGIDWIKRKKVDRAAPPDPPAPTLAEIQATRSEIDRLKAEAAARRGH